MRLNRLAATILILSLGSLLTACQKKPAAETLRAAEMSHSKTTVKSVLNKKDLGILPLSDHVSTTVTLDKNKQCTITPTLLKGGDLQLIVSMEITANDGRPVGMNVARVVAKPGEPFDVPHRRPGPGTFICRESQYSSGGKWSGR